MSWLETVTIPDVPSEWNLHYARYVIEDGGARNRAVGACFDWFAVEFRSEGMLVAANCPTKIMATPIADFQYRVTAKVIYLSNETSVIDFGLSAIGRRDLLPSECNEGDRVSGDIAIGLPISTDIVPEEVLRNLKRRWHVNRISADLTPYISHPDDPSGKWRVRDSSRVRYEQVSRTDSVITSSYVLHCSEASAAK